MLFRDALDNNRSGWLPPMPGAFFRAGVYEWRPPPEGQEVAFPDAGVGRLAGAPGISISAVVTMRDGAALRGVTCRELGPAGAQAQDWYELGIDGRRALVRRVHQGGAPKVLASASAPIANGRAVRITGQCVPDGDGVLLVLRLDGREALRARDAHPLPATRDGVDGAASIFAYQRPDSDRPASLAWDDYVLRRATLAGD